MIKGEGKVWEYDSLRDIYYYDIQGDIGFQYFL